MMATKSKLYKIFLNLKLTIFLLGSFFIFGCSPFGKNSIINFNIFKSTGVLVDDKGNPTNLTSPKNITWQLNGVDESNVQSYEISVGTSPGSNDFLSWTNVGNIKNYTLATTFNPATTYYVNVRYIKSATLTISNVFTSDGFLTPADGPEQIATGLYHTCVLSKAGNVKCWGDNTYGQLGYDDNQRRGDGSPAPYNMASLQNVNLGQKAKSIAVGRGGFTCVILIDDNVKCWGNNINGQLGYDDSFNRGNGSAAPYNMASLSNVNLGQTVKSISTGGYSTCAILNDNAVKCWGSNAVGNLGYDDTFGRGDGSAAPYDMASLPNVNLGQPVKSISTGSYSTCAILNDNAVKCWGYNGDGRLGYDDNLARGYGSAAPYDMASLPIVNLGQGAKAITAGYISTCAVLLDDSLKCWGSNYSGNLGYDDNNNRGDGSIAPYNMVSLLPVNLGLQTKSIVLGNGNACVVTSTDHLKCWGDNYYGQLGYDDKKNRGDGSAAPYDMTSLPEINLGKPVKSVSISGVNSCAILIDDSIKCWGYNGAGNLGYDHTIDHGNSSVSGLTNAPNSIVNALAINFNVLPSTTSFKQIVKSISSSYTCGILADDSVRCWGENGYGQLGYDDTISRGDGSMAPYDMASLPAVNLGQGAKSIALGSGHTCALLMDDTIKCWGNNYYGQLGYDDTINRGDGTVAPYRMASLPAVNLGLSAKSIGVSDQRTCAVLIDDTVKCWGANYYGQLGYDDPQPRGSGLAAPYDMASLSAIDLGLPVKSISVGYYHTCAILSNDLLKCWGANYSGETGYDDTAYHGLYPGDMAALTFVNLGQTVKSVSAGNGYTCAVLADNTARCWGRSNYGQLGYDDNIARGDGSAAPYDMASLGPINLGQTVKLITAGYEHTCAILFDNKMKCWGRNYGGELGYDDTELRGMAWTVAPYDIASLTTVNFNQDVKNITVGNQSTCAILNDNSTKCWGAGYNGQLGNDAQTNISDTPGFLGWSMADTAAVFYIP